MIRPLADRDVPAVDDRTRTDLIDLIVLWADLRGHFASVGEAVEAKREALRVLTDAESLLGSSPSLERQRRTYAAALGQEKEPSDCRVQGTLRVGAL